MIQQGIDFNLVCEATGIPQPTIIWTLSDGPFPHNVEQIGNTLYIRQPQISNRGIYICYANNSVSSDESHTSIYVEKREPPQLELQPREPQVVSIGDPIQLSCGAVAGRPTPTITWARRDRPLSPRFKELYPGTISLEQVSLEDAGEYECRAENSVGQVSVSTAIIVHEAPTVHLNPNTDYMKLTVGDELKIECIASGIPTPSITWTQPIQMIRTASSSFNTNIQIYRVTLEHSGRYTCRAENSAGTQQKDIFVEIEKKRGDVGESDRDIPTHHNPNHNNHNNNNNNNEPESIPPYYAFYGEEAKLTCDVSGYVPHIEWRRLDGSPLPYNAIVNGNQLIFERTEESSGGKYECVITDGTNPPFTAAIAELVLVDAPRITFSPAMPLLVHSGNNVNIECIVQGEQPITVVWHTEHNRPFPHSVKVHNNHLRFDHITPADAGIYRCSAWNRVGNVTRSAEVIVNRK